MPELAPIAALRHRYLRGDADPLTELDARLALANSNAGKNVYLAHDSAWSRDEAGHLLREVLDIQPLWGIPISLKDCFDLAGFPTSCGSAFYKEQNGTAATDSAVAATPARRRRRHHRQDPPAPARLRHHRREQRLRRLRAARATPTRLTGGSSSGAVASVQEGSALAAIGTDTGGSIRTPAALCGLIGYRSLHHAATAPPCGAAERTLLPSFDTLGWLYATSPTAPSRPAPSSICRSPLHAPARRAAHRHPRRRSSSTTASPPSSPRCISGKVALRQQGARLTAFDAAALERPLRSSPPSRPARPPPSIAATSSTSSPPSPSASPGAHPSPPPSLAALRSSLPPSARRRPRSSDALTICSCPAHPCARSTAGVDHRHTRDAHPALHRAASASAACPSSRSHSGHAGGLQLIGPLGSTPSCSPSAPAFGASEAKTFSQSQPIPATLHPWDPARASHRCPRAARLPLAAHRLPANASSKPTASVPVTFQADWYPQPEHGGFYDALAKGYYKQEGLDVTILPGGPYVADEALVATGQIQFAMNSSDHVLEVHRQRRRAHRRRRRHHAARPPGHHGPRRLARPHLDRPQRPDRRRPPRLHLVGVHHRNLPPRPRPRDPRHLLRRQLPPGPQLHPAGLPHLRALLRRQGRSAVPLPAQPRRGLRPLPRLLHLAELRAAASGHRRQVRARLHPRLARLHAGPHRRQRAHRKTEPRHEPRLGRLQLQDPQAGQLHHRRRPHRRTDRNLRPRPLADHVLSSSAPSA